MFCCALSVKSKFDMRKSVVVSEESLGCHSRRLSGLYMLGIKALRSFQKPEARV